MLRERDVCTIPDFFASGRDSASILGALACSRTVLGAFFAVPGRLWGLSSRSWDVLRRSRDAFGTLFGARGRPKSLPEPILTRSRPSRSFSRDRVSIDLRFQCCTIAYDCTIPSNVACFCTRLRNSAQSCKPVQYCMILQHCTALHSTAQYCTILYSAAQYCTILQNIVRYCTIVVRRQSSNQNFLIEFLDRIS